MKIKSEYIDIVFSVLFGLIAIFSYVTQILFLNEKTTAQETTLFNALQFILTLGFAWFSTRAITRYEYEKSLKKFALSAYRRIIDITNIINKLKSHLNQIFTIRDNYDSYDEINLINAIVEDMELVTRSSVADWTDIIGKELIAFNKMKDLEEEKNQINLEKITTDIQNKYEKELKKIDEDINSLKQKIPANLLVDYEIPRSNTTASNRDLLALKKKYEIEDGLKLEVISGSSYGDYKLPFMFKKGDKLKCNTKLGALDVYTDDDVKVGRIINYTSHRYDRFRDILRKGFQTLDFDLEFVKILNKDAGRDKDLVSYSVSVLNELVL